MKRLLAILLSLTLALSMVPTAWAEGEEDDGNAAPYNTETQLFGTCGATDEDNVTWALTKNNEDSDNPTYTLTISGDGAMNDYGNPIGEGTTVAPWYAALAGKADVEKAVPVTEITVEEGVTKIGSWAFAYTQVEEASFAKSVKEYGIHIYSNCLKLTTVDWTNFHPERVWLSSTQNVYEGAGIPGNMFDHAESLHICKLGDKTYTDTLVVPDTVKAVGDGSFYLTAFTTVDFSDGLKGVEKVAFYSFAHMPKLKNLYVTARLQYILGNTGSNAFSEQAELDAVTFEEGVTEIPKNAFRNCDSLKTLSFPSSLTYIGEYAFNADKALEAVDLTKVANSLTVDRGAFNAYESAEMFKLCAFYVADKAVADTLRDKNHGNRFTAHGYFAVTNGGTFPADTVFTEGALATPVRGNYTFDGWYSDAAFTENKKLADSAAPAVDTIYYAKWVSTIAFDANGGELPTGTTNPAVVNEGSAIGTLPTPTRTSYTFVGWNTAADGFGKFVTESEIPTGDMTLYAVWGTAAGSGYTILPIEDQTYTGQPLTPTVYMVDASKNRIAAAGVSYENNTNAGTATAKVTLDGTEYTVTFTIVPKLIAKPTADTTEFIYTGSEQTYTVAESADYIVSNNTRTNAGSQSVTVALVDKDNTRWADNTADDVTFTFTIGKATPVISLSVDKTTLYGGGTVKLTVSDAPQEGTVNVTCDVDDINIVDNGDGTFSATLPNETKTYAFTAAYTAAENGNYNNADTAPCTVSVTRYVPSAPGSSVTVPATSNGSVTVSPSTASKGTTVTVTTKPNEGYELGSLEVLDKNGNALALKDLGNGKYSFTMPDGKVSVNANFVKASVSIGFADVPANAYYADAVKWAVDKGVTNGLSANLFGPYEPCTRAQIVTFLWRAAGSPEPKATTSKMTDLDPNAYYYKAVLWAIENGITAGMTDTTFAPNATCTRGQSVTFLYRALGKKASGSANFSDVAANAFYADAVNWAVENNVTNGTSATTFSPNADCTRAEIVTFLYRAYQGK